MGKNTLCSLLILLHYDTIELMLFSRVKNWLKLPFDLDLTSDSNVSDWIRFTRDNIWRLEGASGTTNVTRLSNCSRCKDLEILCILLGRLCYFDRNSFVNFFFLRRSKPIYQWRFLCLQLLSIAILRTFLHSLFRFGWKARNGQFADGLVAYGERTMYREFYPKVLDLVFFEYQVRDWYVKLLDFPSIPEIILENWNVVNCFYGREFQFIHAGLTSELSWVEFNSRSAYQRSHSHFWWKNECRRFWSQISQWKSQHRMFKQTIRQVFPWETPGIAFRNVCSWNLAAYH